MADTIKKMKVVIIVLSILLGLSLSALAGVVILDLFGFSIGSAVVPDNYIEPSGNSEVSMSFQTNSIKTPMLLSAFVPNVNMARVTSMASFFDSLVLSNKEQAAVISIYKNHAEDSTPFNVANMFPGDSETKTYYVDVSHRGKLTVHFRVDIYTGYKKLAEVLKCKVVLRDENKVLYDGLMRDIPEGIDHTVNSSVKTTTRLTYDITVYLDTSVGNEYMNKELEADFCWWVEDKSVGPFPPYPIDPDEPDEPDEPDDPVDPEVPVDPDKPDEPDEPDDPIDPDDPDDPDDPGELVNPPGSDITYVFVILLIVSFIIIILLLLNFRRKKGEKKDGNENE